MVDKLVKGLSDYESKIWQRFSFLSKDKGFRIKDYILDLMEEELEKTPSKDFFSPKKIEKEVRKDSTSKSN